MHTYTLARDRSYTAYLKHCYKPKQEDNCVDGNITWPPPVTNKVFRLAIIKSDNVIRRRNNKRDCNILWNKINKSHKDLIELGELFNGIERDKQRKVLIEGVAGSGKSTLSLYICHQWRAGKLFKEYKQVILVKLRERSVQQAQNIVDILPHDSDTMKFAAEKEITDKGGMGVLFIFDGWDELPHNSNKPFPYTHPVVDVLKGRKLCNCSIIITSRPISTLDLQLCVSSRFEILGFDKSELRKYFSDCLNNESMQVNTFLQKIQEIPAVEASCCIPLNASILVHLFKCENRLPPTEYEIFCEVVLNCIVRHQKKQGIDSKLISLDRLPSDIKKDFDYLCEIAYTGAKNGTIIFDKCDLRRDFNTLGLVQGVESFTKHGESISYNFIHLAIQELLSAIYLATQLEPSEQVEEFEMLFGQPRFTGIFRYYAAHTKLSTSGIGNIINRAVTYPKRAKLISTHSDDSNFEFQESTFEYTPQTLLLSVIHCLFHAEDDRLNKSVAQQLNQQLDLSYIRLNPADCHSLSYFLSYCGQFSVDLKNCSIDTDGCKMLFRQNGSYPLKILKYVNTIPQIVVRFC